MEHIAGKGLEFVKKCIAFAVCTPNHNWSETEYQAGVVLPLQKVKQILARLEAEQREPNVEEMQEALQMVFSVFTTKQISGEERSLRLKRLATGIEEPKIVGMLQ